MGPRRIAEAYAAVMASLGYSRYGVEGSDFGSMVAVTLADSDANHLAGLHLSTVPVMRSFERIERALPPKGIDADTLTPEIQETLQLDAERWRSNAPLRAMQQGQPQTVGFALEDSPAGLLAWFGGGEYVMRESHAKDLTDSGATVSPREHLLTNLSLYWFTRTVTSALRLYTEVGNAGRRNVPQEYVRVPTGIRMASADVSHTPREWVERKYNVTHWLEGRPGGHFAAADAPLAYVDDLRLFFRGVR
jgi:pimeloyl-ACP methyl ester carboxylesterase